MLKEKVIVVQLYISQWNARKFDAETTDEVNAAKNAEDAARVTKKLLASPELDAINKVAGKARRYHNKMTLPWDDKGPRILSVTEHLNYVKEMEKYKAEFISKVEAFVPLFKDLVKSRKKEMGDLFNPDDYPSPKELRDKFKMKYLFTPISDSEDLRVKASKEEVKSLQKNIEESLKHKMNLAKGDIRERVREVVAKYYEKVSNKKAVFRDSLVHNITAIIEFIPTLNFDNDESINKLAKKINKLCVKPEKIRTNRKVRAKMTKKAKKLLKELKPE